MKSTLNMQVGVMLMAVELNGNTMLTCFRFLTLFTFFFLMPLRLIFSISNPQQANEMDFLLPHPALPKAFQPTRRPCWDPVGQYRAH